jgi:hypothetical protein
MPERHAFIIGACFLHKIFIRKQEKDKNGEKEPVQPQILGPSAARNSNLLRLRIYSGFEKLRPDTTPRPSVYQKKDARLKASFPRASLFFYHRSQFFREELLKITSTPMNTTSLGKVGFWIRHISCWTNLLPRRWLPTRTVVRKGSTCAMPSTLS